MEIRYLTAEDDWNEVCRVYEESWRCAYKGIIPDWYLKYRLKGKWVSHLDNPAIHSLAAIEDGKIIGTSSISRSRFSDMEGYGEIISIYFLPEYMGRGFGGPLLRAAIEELSKMGFEDVFLWVLEKNHRARHFYEKFGFKADGGAMETKIGMRKLREIRYIYHVE